jgi:hypothetical protein
MQKTASTPTVASNQNAEPDFKVELRLVAKLTTKPLKKSNQKLYDIYSAVPTNAAHLEALKASGKDTVSVNFTHRADGSTPEAGDIFQGWGMVIPSTDDPTKKVTFIEYMGAPLSLNGDLGSIFG